MKYPEFKQLNLSQINKDILKFWQEEDIFKQSVSGRPASKPFTFYEGPPSANGMPGIHHVMARTIKDIFCRYKTLQGYRVERKGGWDTHGLPIELAVEKALGITKEDIGKKISVEEYNKQCRREVMKYKEVWDNLTQKMGYWVDLDNPYITFENSYIETLWWLLKQLYEKGLLYKGYTIQPFSPAAGTGLSSHELNQPGCYRPIKDTSVVAQFKVFREQDHSLISKLFNDNKGDVYFLAWTTTPWTLPGNCALAVGEKISYVQVNTFNPYTFAPVSLILAKDLLGSYFHEKNSGLKLEEYKPGEKTIPFRVVAEYKGKDLESLHYEQLMPYVQPAEGDAFRVIIGDFVSTEDGTGIVHTASVFGADDFRVCRQNNVPSILVKDENGNPSPLVDRQGRFVKEVTDFAGEHVKEQFLTEEEKEVQRSKQGREKYLSVDERIAIKLKEENKAFKVEKYEHNYPHCWRTDKPILYYPLDSWFIRTTAVKNRMVELNQTINWKPEATGTGRFGNWLENLVDWNLSRSRFWGTPLPIWRTEDGTEEKCIGSIEELKREIKKAIEAGVEENSKFNQDSTFNIDLHRPYVDEIVLVSDKGKKMYREPDLIDVWFDSGAMPYAQWHYPFENETLFKDNYPADFIAEGVDQTRGWFFTLHAIAVMLFDSVAFKNVVSNGLVLDKNGNKMSKRLGNAVDPFDTIEKHGADATRWYLISNAAPWDNLKFSMDGLQEVQRKFFGTLYNTYSFFALYANIDEFEVDEHTTIPIAKRAELDRWIISRLQKLILEAEEYYNRYEPHRVARAIQEFVDEHLSNWYVRLSRRRFWRGEMTEDKKAAYETLHECLAVVSQLMSPIAPFFADWLYKNLSDCIRAKAGKSHLPVSVHLSNWKKADKALIDEELNECMQLAQDICSLLFSLRKKVDIRVRQPLKKILLPVLNKEFQHRVEKVKELILSETNVKEIEYVHDTSGIVIKKIKPNFKQLGKKAGPMMKELAAKISALSQEEIATLENSGSFKFEIEQSTFDIQREDVEISSEDIPGWLVATKETLTVALDVTITEDLKHEGIARDLVNRIQNIRKEKDFEVTDRINVTIHTTDEFRRAINNNLDYIRAEILARSLDFSENSSHGEAVEIDDQQLTIVVERAEI